MSAEPLALLESDPAAGILRVAEEVEAEASRASYGYGQRFDIDDPEKGAWLTDFLLTLARHWRGVVERHRMDPDEYCAMCITRAWPCPDLRETADEARAYLGGTP